jgi:hypothetical protein
MPTVTRILRERVWAAGNAKLEVVTIDAGTTVHTLYGQQMGPLRATSPRTRQGVLPADTDV